MGGALTKTRTKQGLEGGASYMYMYICTDSSSKATTRRANQGAKPTEEWISNPARCIIRNMYIRITFYVCTDYWQGERTCKMRGLHIMVAKVNRQGKAGKAVSENECLQQHEGGRELCT